VGTEKTKKLPKGVGKRIIASLKNHETEAGYEEEDISKELEYPDLDDSSESPIEEENVECLVAVEAADALEDTYECYSQSQSRAVQQPEPQYAQRSEQQYYEKYEYRQEKPAPVPTLSDIDTLLDLISRLPSGVTKQTGALIIRQTMEAMGMPMNKVLANAQSSQEELENNIRNNVNIIEEYRTNIKILEQEIQKYRRKSHDLEDIISLFILSEEKR
jgi:hypothetical protein